MDGISGGFFSFPSGTDIDVCLKKGKNECKKMRTQLRTSIIQGVFYNMVILFKKTKAPLKPGTLLLFNCKKILSFSLSLNA